MLVSMYVSCHWMELIIHRRFSVQESEGYLGPRKSWPQPAADSMANAESDAVGWNGSGGHFYVQLWL